MKKLLTAISALALVAVLGACGSREEANEPTTTDAGTSTDVDTRATSVVGNTAEELQAAMAADGPWVFGATADIDSDDVITVDGNVYKTNDESLGYTRKIGLYSRVGNGDRTIASVFNLTAPSIVVNAENTMIMGGEVENLGDLDWPVVDADIYVNANGFELISVIVNGDIIFSSQAYADSANLDGATVNGEQIVE
ncbi:MAG: hypothetical protein FWF59_08070 [Turicibacter sp.]|nr:hypothetical protein [Turicibacter sp.]